MREGYFEEHWRDENGRPAGGSSFGRGFAISWQNGPLGSGNRKREPNGAFAEDVIAAASGRIIFYQNSEFACEENAEALVHLERALKALGRRTFRRERAGVEGTHEGS